MLTSCTSSEEENTPYLRKFGHNIRNNDEGRKLSEIPLNYSKNTSGPCLNLNVSSLTECDFVATFCASDHSAPCWFVERKLGRRFLKKVDISGSIEPSKSLKTGHYFCNHQGFVFTRADNNLFVTQLIMREINSSWHHVFVPLCGTLNTIKLIWEVETHVGENFFQFNHQQILRLSHSPHLPITRSGARLMQNQQITRG